MSKQLESLSLDKLCAILESKKRDDLRSYLQKRFFVDDYDQRYKILDAINLKTIFTTNIDNLLFKILESSSHHYLNDITIHGPVNRDREVIDFVPLHGSIVHEDKPLTFSTLEIVAAFQTDADRWHTLTSHLQDYPTLFWGYNLADADVLQALSPETIKQRSHKEKWIVLRNPDEPTREYFKALDFSLIISDTSEMLDYLSEVNIRRLPISISDPNMPQLQANVAINVPTNILFKEYAIPEAAAVPVRPLRDFYQGYAPVWHDIFNDRIYKTSHYRKVINLINSHNDIIVLGIVASGKTTLMMQIANDFQFDGHKLVCSTLTPEKAHLIINKLAGAKVLIFVDDFTDSLDAFNILADFSNIQVIGFDRDTNFEAGAHKINIGSQNIWDITPLTDEDMQGIYSDIPKDIRNFRFRVPGTPEGIFPSLFELIERNTNRVLPELRFRFRSLLQQLEKENQALHDLLIMIAYVHSCRTPVSYDMALAFLRGYADNYDDIKAMIHRLGNLVAEVLADAEQDYYSPRSNIVSEAILKSATSISFRRVFLQFHKQISPFRIYNYDVFKRKAFDAGYAEKAFPTLRDWEEGRTFYEDAYRRDDSAFFLQQGALFLSHKKQFKEAFDWIERAVRKTEYRVFSIRNSHAIILFNANIDLARRDPRNFDIRKTLDESMSILEDCYRREHIARKTYHALTFGNQALDYWHVYRDDTAKHYLETAITWLHDEKKRAPWRMRDIKRLAKRIETQLLTS